MRRVLATLAALTFLTAPLAFAAVPVATTHVVLNEVLYHPAGAEAGAEAVELYNPTPLPVDLSGWSLSDGDRCLTEDGWTSEYRLALNGTLAPLDVLVVTIPATSDFFGCLSLANGGDSLELLDGTGDTVDKVTWPGDAPAGVAEGLSIQRCHLLDDDGAPALDGTWFAEADTLGASNARCA